MATSNRSPVAHSVPIHRCWVNQVRLITCKAERTGQAEMHAQRMDQYRRGDLVFDVIDEGPADGPRVVLLDG